MASTGTHLHPADPAGDAPSGKRRGGKQEWVRPSLLLALASVLVVVTTLVVVFRGRSRRAASGVQGQTAAVRSGSAPGVRESGGPGGTVPSRTVSGRQDRSEAREFHARFVERLAPRLRLIGFRPDLIAHGAGQGAGPEYWSVRVPSNFPILRVNAEIALLTHDLEGRVFRAEQDTADLGLVTLRVGAGNVVTDDVRLRTDKKLRFKGAIAFVIDDVGYRPASGTDQFIELPYPLTLAILPGHESGPEVARRAVAAGKQVILHLPMEPNGDAVGLEPKTITASMSDDEIRRRTKEHVEATPGLSGVNNHMGSKATEDERVMRIVLSVLAERGLYFLDSRTTPNTIAERIAHEMDVRSGSRNVFLDNERPTPKVVEGILNAATIAEREGKAIAIGHDRTETYQALLQTLPRLEERGLRICLLSELLR